MVGPRDLDPTIRPSMTRLFLSRKRLVDASKSLIRLNNLSCAPILEFNNSAYSRNTLFVVGSRVVGAIEKRAWDISPYRALLFSLLLLSACNALRTASRGA